MAKKKVEGFLKLKKSDWKGKKSLFLLDVSAIMRTYYVPTLTAEEKSRLNHWQVKREPLTYEIDGKVTNTSAVYGLFQTMLKYGLENDFAFCFDLPFGNKLKEIDETYKKNRINNKPKDEYYEQVNRVREILGEVGYNVFCEPKLEGDHMIFAGVETNYEDYEFIGVVTNDKDMSWLVDEKVHWIGVTQKQSDITIDNYEQILGCPYNTIFIKKALVGDSADNIKGVVGIGEVGFKNFCEKANLKNRKVKGKEKSIIQHTEFLNDKQRGEALHSLRLVLPQEVSVDTKYQQNEIDKPMLQGFLDLYGMQSMVEEWNEEV